MDTASLSGGFSKPPIDAAHAFRAIMQAMARPGTIHEIGGTLPPAPMSISAGTVILTLCDATTPLHLAGTHDHDLLRDWVTFQTNAPLASAPEAAFVLGTWDSIDLAPLKIGTPEYPDCSATLIVELPDLRQEGTTLHGPGIEDVATLSLPETPAFRNNHALFPLGLDFIFTCGTKVAALPRTTEVA